MERRESGPIVLNVQMEPVCQTSALCVLGLLCLEERTTQVTLSGGKGHGKCWNQRERSFWTIRTAKPRGSGAVWEPEDWIVIGSSRGQVTLLASQ